MALRRAFLPKRYDHTRMVVQPIPEKLLDAGHQSLQVHKAVNFICLSSLGVARGVVHVNGRSGMYTSTKRQYRE